MADDAHTLANAMAHDPNPQRGTLRDEFVSLAQSYTDAIDKIGRQILEAATLLFPPNKEAALTVRHYAFLHYLVPAAPIAQIATLEEVLQHAKTVERDTKRSKGSYLSEQQLFKAETAFDAFFDAYGAPISGSKLDQRTVLTSQNIIEIIANPNAATYDLSLQTEHQNATLGRQRQLLQGATLRYDIDRKGIANYSAGLAPRLGEQLATFDINGTDNIIPVGLTMIALMTAARSDFDREINAQRAAATSYKDRLATLVG